MSRRSISSPPVGERQPMFQAAGRKHRCGEGPGRGAGPAAARMDCRTARATPSLDKASTTSKAVTSFGRCRGVLVSRVQLQLRLVDWRRSPARGADTRVRHPRDGDRARWARRQPLGLPRSHLVGIGSPWGATSPIRAGTDRPRPGRAPAVSLLAGARGQSAPARDLLLRILTAAWHRELEGREPIWSTRPARTVSERG